MQQVVDRFPQGQFTWKKRLEEFGESWLPLLWCVPRAM
jgi:hypothetical protein